MRVLLTGASGFLGKHVLARLRAYGAEVVLLGRSRPADTADLPWLALDMLDQSDWESTLQQVRASHLLHLAWYAEHGHYWNSPLNLRWVDATLRLLQGFTANGGRHVVMAGTCAEYDWFGSDQGFLNEASTPLNPNSLYGAAKDATRRLAMAWCKDQGVTLAWGHLFFPFGPGEARQRLLPSLIEVFRGRSKPFGVNAEAWRGMLPVHDAAEALVHLLIKGCSGRYNICSGQAVQLGDVVRHLANLCEADPAPVLELATHRPGDPALLVGCNARLLATGWRPAWTLEQGLAAMIASSQTHPINSCQKEHTMTPDQQFNAERRERLDAYSQDKAFRGLSRQWLQESMSRKYVYNFDWLGRPIIQYPQDMVGVQQLVWTVRPDLIIETGIAHGGSLILSASLLALLDMCDAIEAGATLDPRCSNRKVIGIDIDIRAHNRAAIEAHPMASRIQMFQGSSVADEVVQQVHAAAAGYKTVLVMLDAMHTHDHVLAELQAYAPLVTPGSYCVVFDTFVDDMPPRFFADRPWDVGNNPKTAARQWLAGHPEFEVDATLEQQLQITVAPEGFLRRRL